MFDETSAPGSSNDTDQAADLSQVIAPPQILALQEAFEQAIALVIETGARAAAVGEALKSAMGCPYERMDVDLDQRNELDTIARKFGARACTIADKLLSTPDIPREFSIDDYTERYAGHWEDYERKAAYANANSPLAIYYRIVNAIDPAADRQRVAQDTATSISEALGVGPSVYRSRQDAMKTVAGKVELECRIHGRKSFTDQWEVNYNGLSTLFAVLRGIDVMTAQLQMERYEGAGEAAVKALGRRYNADQVVVSRERFSVGPIDLISYQGRMAIRLPMDLAQTLAQFMAEHARPAGR